MARKRGGGNVTPVPVLEQKLEKGDRIKVEGIDMEVRHVTEYELILVPVKAAKTKAA
jgi:hypothetical protein